MHLVGGLCGGPHPRPLSTRWRGVDFCFRGNDGHGAGGDWGVAGVIYTSGSSGKPTPFYDTVHDRFARIHHLGRVATIAGVGPQDTVMNLFPLSAVPHQGFLSAMWGAMAVGSKLADDPECTAPRPDALATPPRHPGLTVNTVASLCTNWREVDSCSETREHILWSQVTIDWLEKQTRQAPSVMVGRTATRLPRTALPTRQPRPWKETHPLPTTVRTSPSAAYLMRDSAMGRP